MTLPPLPETPYVLGREGNVYGEADRLLSEDAYTADQMHAYAAAAVAAERGRCIAACKRVMAEHDANPDLAVEPDEPNFYNGQACGAEDCIEAINALPTAAIRAQET